MHPLLFFAIEIFSGVGVVLLLSVLVELCPSVPRMLSQMRKKLLPARLQRGGANAQLVRPVVAVTAAPCVCLFACAPRQHLT